MPRATATQRHNILADGNRDKRDELLRLLERAYWMEVETVINYLAHSINPDGVRAREVAESLEKDIAEELGHARLFGNRIKEIYGVVPGSLEFAPEQKYLQPPGDQADIVTVIRGVIQAEMEAIDFYSEIVGFCDDADLVTQDMVIDILRDEQRHLRLFQGFLQEFEQGGLPR